MIDWGEKLEEKIRSLPDSPGCYLMKDAGGTIIYVGKAVNLKNRVRSYFRDTAHTPKVAAMIAHIDDFEILLCDREHFPAASEEAISLGGHLGGCRLR